jgi:hypothetical protein
VVDSFLVRTWIDEPRSGSNALSLHCGGPLSRGDETIWGHTGEVGAFFNSQDILTTVAAKVDSSSHTL